MTTIIKHTATMTEAESRAWRPEIPGWSTDILPFYAEMAKRIPEGGIFVEVGVFLGRSLAFMASIRPDLELWAIDPWADGTSQGYQGPGEFAEYVRSHGGSLWEAFNQTMDYHAQEVTRGRSEGRVHVLRGTAPEMHIPDADFVFIDGAHDYASVKADVWHAFKWMDGTGIISGHDYNPEYNPETHGPDDGRAGVIVAAHELADSVGKPLNLMGTCWWVEL